MLLLSRSVFWGASTVRNIKPLRFPRLSSLQLASFICSLGSPFVTVHRTVLTTAPLESLCFLSFFNNNTLYKFMVFSLYFLTVHLWFTAWYLLVLAMSSVTCECTRKNRSRIERSEIGKARGVSDVRQIDAPQENSLFAILAYFSLASCALRF